MSEGWIVPAAFNSTCPLDSVLQYACLMAGSALWCLLSMAVLAVVSAFSARIDIIFYIWYHAYQKRLLWNFEVS